MVKKIAIPVIILMACTFAVTGQQAMQLNERFGFKDYCFDSQIKTVLVYKDGDELSEPVIELGSDELIRVRFDDLSEGNRILFYTIEHCDADWRPDNVFISDYMRGFKENTLMDYAYSINTQTPYLHYTFTIPNRDVELLTSGNFMLKVFDSSNPDKPLFQKGFSLVEYQVEVLGKHDVAGTRSLEGQQKLNFSINHPSMRVQDPLRELKVRIAQNSQRVPLAPVPEPAFISNATIDYSHPNKNLYNGYNEYLMFDIRTLEFAAQGVARVDVVENKPHVLLKSASIRANSPYFFSKDLNGKLLVDKGAKLRDEKHLEADYVYIYFTLPVSEPFANSTVYVFGQVSDWSIYDGYAMVYNRERKAYELSVLLKQGYYSYQHVVVDSKNTFNPAIVEGNFGETENSYGVYVYYKGVRDRWDRLLGVKYINTSVSF